MSSSHPAPQFALPSDRFSKDYDRIPFGFSHNLHQLDLFSDDSLRRLCAAYGDHPNDYFVSQSAPQPGTAFYAVPRAGVGPGEAYDSLAPGSYKILLKRLEQHDTRFRELLRALFDQITTELQQNGTSIDPVRLESAVFISSPSATTPFHFDPEVNFFSQIEGEKIYHLYPPDALAEDEVEPLYARATVDIGQVDLGRRDPSSEYVFKLRPGLGLHQPQDAPHWVETVGTRSVSYSFVYETRSSRERARVRSFNHYLRRMNIQPTTPGLSPTRDAIKSAAMAAAIPVRKELGKTLRHRFGK